MTLLARLLSLSHSRALSPSLFFFSLLYASFSLSLSLYLSISLSVALNALHAMDEDSTAARIVWER